jgi:ABC-type nitrate/sulfonate/bicarbonate transport system substrate-binding protein
MTRQQLFNPRVIFNFRFGIADSIRPIFLTLLLVLAIFPLWPVRLPAAELPTIEVGLPQDGLFGLGGQYIIDKGLDRKNGFIMKPRWAGVPEILRLLGIQAVSVGLMTPEACLRANANGVPLRLVQPYQTAHMYVLVRKESPYQSIDDLKGKSIALTPEVTTLYNLFDFMNRKRGVNIEKTFQLKKLGAPAIIAVLEKGDVEAGILWEAHVSRLLSSGKYRVILGFRDELAKTLNAKTLPVIWLAALEPWLKTNPDSVAKLRGAWSEADRGVQQDEAHFRKYAKQFFGLESPAEVTLAWQRTKIFLLPTDFKWPDAATLNAEKSWLQQGVDLGMFPKESAGFIDVMFTP